MYVCGRSCICVSERDKIRNTLGTHKEHIRNTIHVCVCLGESERAREMELRKAG